MNDASDTPARVPQRLRELSTCCSYTLFLYGVHVLRIGKLVRRIVVNVVRTEMRLSREAVVDGGMALVDAEGLDALTIRRLAQDLGVTPMALYWHSKNKDELLAGLADRLWTFVDSDVDQDHAWQDQLRVLMGSLAEALRAHPSVTPLCTMGVEKAENGFRTVEAGLAVLARGGFTPEQASDIC